MNRASRARPVLVIAAIAGSLLSAVILSSAPAQAAPHAEDTVLIVHVSGGSSQLRTTITRADTPNVTVRHTFGAQHAFSVRVAAADEAATVARLEAMPGVTSVEHSVVRHFSAGPNDPRLSQQAAYLNAVKAPTAWQTQHGSAAIKIAVIDSGIDVGHPDLAPKIVSTYNAVTGSTVITDAVGHGTFVAGVAAAQTDNGIGVAGAGYDTRLIGVKIAGSDGSISVDDEVAGIRWAADHGANIINLSLGGPDYSSAELTAVTYAQSKGVLVVAAAGNQGDTVKQYPAAYPGVVAVGATDSARTARADFSSYGPWVRLAAPGVGIVSTAPRAGSQFFPTTSGYAAGDGTSFSAPLVAGEAALLKAQNPAQSVAQLRLALIASAHGYQNRGLGAGQVDFAAALKHVPPTTNPTALTVTGTQDRLELQATSSAAEVRFRIDSDPYLAPTPVAGGVATVNWASWGFPNGPHTLRAVDCTAYGECGSSGAPVTFNLANDAPAVTSPAADSTATGRFTIAAEHPSGGGAQLLVDGHVSGFAATSPYSFPVNGTSLSDAQHTVQVQLCSTTGDHCGGPASPDIALTSASLHPKITSFSPARISPNHDRVKDTGTLTFALPDPESVVVQTLDRAGAVVRSAPLGTLDPGPHTWIWRGRHDDGSNLADGSYTVAIASSHAVDGFTRLGWTSRTGIIDVHAPTMTKTTGNRAVFYPYKDTYKDAFTPRTTLNDAGTLTLTVRDAHGRTIRTVSAVRAKGAAAISWYGSNSGGHRVAAGTYTWTFTITDAAGNMRRTPTYHVTVSAKRLVTTTTNVTARADSASDSGGTKPSCSYASRSQSVFAHGLRLVDGCSAAGFDYAFARFVFTAPQAVSYKRLAIQAYGHSQHRPSELMTSVQRNDGGVEVPGYRKITFAGNQWYTIASVPAAGHVTAHRHSAFELILDSYYPGRNDFDLGYARLRITYVTLR